MATTEIDAATQSAIDGLEEMTVYTLARLADCASPDAIDSPGARFLDSVRDAVVEEIRYNGIPDLDFDAHEIADAAPDVYTHTRWSEFIDLAAYNEDISDLMPEVDDLTRAAGVALYIIAERLVFALIDDARETAESNEVES